MDDTALLRQFAHDPAAAAALTDLVRRHLDLVYSAALRQVHDPHHAEDVTQAVFMILAKKAKRIGPGVVLAGWLLNATRFACKDLMKAEARRRRREQEAAKMRPEITPAGTGGSDPQRSGADGSDWAVLAPVIDDAIGKLARPSRDALVLRYFEGKSTGEIAGALGVSEVAARERVSRALRQLHGALTRNGVALPAAAVGSALAAGAVHAAPAGLTAPAVAAAATNFAAGAGGAAAGHAASTWGLAKGAIAMMAWTKLKTAIVCVAALLLLGGAGAVAVRQFSPAPRTVVLAPPDGARLAPAAAATTITTVAGLVRGPDGSPLAGAEALVSTPKTMAMIYRSDTQGTASARTGADGRFSVAVPGEPLAVVVRNERGYRQVLWQDFKAAPEIKVEPWGKIEGVLRSGADPLPGRTVVLTRLGNEWERWRVAHDAMARTDGAGRFRFPRVAPGDTWVALRLQQQSPGYSMLSRMTYVAVTPGSSQRVQLGGTGRPLVGRIDADGAPGPGPGHFRGTLARANYKGMPLPDEWDRLSPEEREKRWAAWSESPASAAQARQPFAIAFDVEPDGSFRIEDVPQGRYQITLHADAPPEHGVVEPLGWVEAEVTVPAMATERMDEPLTIPPLKPTWLKRLSPGEPFPALNLVDFDGKPHSLSERPGKYTLVHLWGEAQVGGIGQAAGLREVFDCFGQRPQFAMLGIIVARDAAAARVTFDSVRPGWPQLLLTGNGFLLPPELANVPVPQFLLDRDGKLVAKNLDARAAFTLIGQTLPRPVAPPGMTIATESFPLGKASAAFAFKKVPRPAENNLARRATVHVIAGTPGTQSRLEALNDGRLPGGENEPPANFYFENGLSGRFRIDLAKPASVEQINTYSWHVDTRGPQVYRVWASDGAAAGFNPAPPVGTDPATCGWRAIADVNTRPVGDPAPGGQYGVSIRAAGPNSLGHFRHLLFQTFVTETRDGWGHTFYSEINVVGRED